MSAPQPIIYVIAGCNGAGKTTFAREFLPKEVKCLRFLNADEIARGLSPFNPSASAVQAGRILLSEIQHCLANHEKFALESTLSGTTYIRILQSAKERGFRIHLHYLWLPSPAVAIARVRERVKKGGHHVPSADLRRRFSRSLTNLVESYAALADQWAIWDNQTSPPRLMAESETCPISTLRTILCLK